jgi:hypothetical protein
MSSRQTGNSDTHHLLLSVLEIGSTRRDSGCACCDGATRSGLRRETGLSICGAQPQWAPLVPSMGASMRAGRATRQPLMQLHSRCVSSESGMGQCSRTSRFEYTTGRSACQARFAEAEVPRLPSQGGLRESGARVVCGCVANSRPLYLSCIVIANAYSAPSQR